MKRKEQTEETKSEIKEVTHEIKNSATRYITFMCHHLKLQFDSGLPLKARCDCKNAIGGYNIGRDGSRRPARLEDETIPRFILTDCASPPAGNDRGRGTGKWPPGPHIAGVCRLPASDWVGFTLVGMVIVRVGYMVLVIG